VFSVQVMHSNLQPFLRRFLYDLLNDVNVLPLQGFEVTHPIFELFNDGGARLPDVFHHLVPNDNFHRETAFLVSD